MLRSILLSTSLCTLLAGCGGLEPNTLWEVSRIEGSRPASCYFDNKLPSSMTTSTGVEANIGPWEMYEGPENKMFLILGDKQTVVEGTKKDSYTYEWSTTTTETQQIPSTVTATKTKANTLNFKVNGDTLTGTWEVRETYTCTGTSCMGTTPNCTVTHQIKGRKLDIERLKVY